MLCALLSDRVRYAAAFQKRLDHFGKRIDFSSPAWNGFHVKKEKLNPDGAMCGIRTRLEKCIFHTVLDPNPRTGYRTSSNTPISIQATIPLLSY